LALIVAKNAVGSSWTKQTKSREWKKVPEDEKVAIRTMLLTNILPNDPSETIAIQALLLIANIAQFDYPDKWPELLDRLMGMGLQEGGLPLARRHRPLKAIKYVSRSLERKRFVLEEPSGAPLMSLTPERLHALSNLVESSRMQMKASMRALLQPLMSVWESEFNSSQLDPSSWRERMKICRIAISSCNSVLWAVDNIQLDRRQNNEAHYSQVDEVILELFSSSCSMAAQAAKVVFCQQPWDELAPNYLDQEKHDAVSKVWERLLTVGIVGLTKHSVKFATSMPSWIDLCVHKGVMAMDPSTVHRLRNKSRVLSIRLLARMLLHPFFRQRDSNGLAWTSGSSITPAFHEPKAHIHPDVQTAMKCLEDLLSFDSGSCTKLVESIISKYIVLTPEEKFEWESDPEGFAREVDLETSPDADTPRPCGVGLLECMLEYSPDNSKRAIMEVAQRVAQNLNATDDSITAREAVYRIVGECFPHLRFMISFDQWYENEIKCILMGSEPSLGAMSPFSRSILTSRCLWLVGVCGEEMSVAPFTESFAICTSKIEEPDLVVSLMAVSAVGALLAQVIEEQAFSQQPAPTRYLLLEGPIRIPDEEDNIIKQAELEYQTHLNVVLANLDTLLANCFQLLPNLSEVESMVRVIQCVTSSIELVGTRISSHFESFTRCIPPLWQMINDTSKGQDRAALVRLQCSILAMLAHLISKLGRAAISSPDISRVVYPLLLSSTDPRNAAAEPLAEDALRLWLSVLHSSPELTNELVELGPARLIPHLERGKELEFCLRIAAAYALHGGPESVGSMLPLVASRIDQVICSVVQSFQRISATPPAGSTLQSISLIPPQAARELDSALTLLGILQRLHSDLPNDLEKPLKSTCDLLCMDFRRGSRFSSPSTSFVPGRLVHLLHPALQIISRFLYTNPSAIGFLTDYDRNSQVRLIDRWVTLGSSQDVGEVFAPQVSALGRARRHNLAVSMCALILKDTCELLRDGPRVARSLIMCLKAALEQSVFEKEHELLFSDSANGSMQEQNDPSQPQDFLREKRLSVTRKDPLRSVDAMDALRQAAGHVIRWLGREGLLSILEQYNPVFSTEMSRIICSQLSEEETNLALQALEAAHL
jgi:hypothetical protein